MALLIAPVAHSQAPEPLRFARVFGDHMVLQRDRPLRIWGWGPAGEVVTVVFAGHSAQGRADDAGAWSVTLRPLAASAAGHDLTATAGGADGAPVCIRDVLVGDVWLCGGQSNMAWGLDGCDSPEDVAAADLPRIRYRPYFEHFAGEQLDDLRERLEWRVMTPATAGACSAVGFYFARAVQPVAEVPIGLLECTVGGTSIECWMPPAAFADYPENRHLGEERAHRIAEWQRALVDAIPAVEQWTARAREAAAAGERIPPPPRLPGHPNEDRAHWCVTQSLYNGMVHPMVGFGLRGVLWYQGENNAGEDSSYAAKLTALIETWRAAWRRELPFHVVQLASYGRVTDDPAGGDLGFAPCRMAQLQCARLPGVGLAVTIDIGDGEDIHPRNKRDVGERLARWALAREYGQALEPGGPMFVSCTAEGDALRVRFDHVGAGLMVGRKPPRGPAVEDPEAPLRGFALAGADRRWRWAIARIDGDTVLAHSDEVREPMAVRYAFTANPEGCNLYNRDGLPASPFRSDDW